MSEHPNVEVVRELFADFRAGRVERIREALAPDATWHFPGRRGGLAGTHRGQAAILAFLARVMQLTQGRFHFELEDVLANDRLAIALFRGRAERNGRKLDNPTCLKIRLENGRAVELWEFVWDLHHVEEFWS